MRLAVVAVLVACSGGTSEPVAQKPQPQAAVEIVDAAGAAPDSGVAAAVTQRHGELPFMKVVKVMKQHAPAIRRCYERFLKSGDPTHSSGTVQLVFVIAADGSVESSTVTGLDVELDACAKKIVDAMRFPAPTGGSLEVSYPLKLVPG